MSYIVEVQERNGGPWVANGVRFATVEEAEFAKDDLAGRWFAPHAFRTTESDKPANYVWSDGESRRIEGTLQSDLELHRALGSNS